MEVRTYAPPAPSWRSAGATLSGHKSVGVCIAPGGGSRRICIELGAMHVTGACFSVLPSSLLFAVLRDCALFV